MCRCCRSCKKAQDLQELQQHTGGLTLSHRCRSCRPRGLIDRHEKAARRRLSAGCVVSYNPHPWQQRSIRAAARGAAQQAVERRGAVAPHGFSEPWSYQRLHRSRQCLGCCIRNYRSSASTGCWPGWICRRALNRLRRRRFRPAATSRRHFLSAGSSSLIRHRRLSHQPPHCANYAFRPSPSCTAAREKPRCWSSSA